MYYGPWGVCVSNEWACTEQPWWRGRCGVWAGTGNSQASFPFMPESDICACPRCVQGVRQFLLVAFIFWCWAPILMEAALQCSQAILCCDVEAGWKVRAVPVRMNYYSWELFCLEWLISCLENCGCLFLHSPNWANLSVSSSLTTYSRGGEHCDDMPVGRAWGLHDLL